MDTVISFVDDTAAGQYDCGICLNKLKNPVYIGCGSHFFCNECILKLLSHSFSGQFPCPNCRHLCDQSQINRIEYIDRQMDQLQVRCPNHQITPTKLQWLRRQKTNKTTIKMQSKQSAEDSSFRCSGRINSMKSKAPSPPVQVENGNNISLHRSRSRASMTVNTDVDSPSNSRSRSRDRYNLRHSSHSILIELHSKSMPFCPEKVEISQNANRCTLIATIENVIYWQPANGRGIGAIYKNTVQSVHWNWCYVNTAAYYCSGNRLNLTIKNVVRSRSIARNAVKRIFRETVCLRIY